MLGRPWLARSLYLTLALAAAHGARSLPAADGNRLAGQTSPYLLQHASNPVHWRPWGPEAFADARREGKPVFLSVGYSACYWCHVMARESFADPETAALLNETAIPVKVDREERPDVDDLYMTAVQLQNGTGGWPMTVFLTPEGEPFYAATYMRKADFQKVVREVKEAWRDPKRREELREQAARMARAVGAAASRVPTPGTLSPAVFSTAVRSSLDDYDERNGGFGEAPKFPPATRLGLLLAGHRRNPDSEEGKRALAAVRLTLDRMAAGGLRDHLGGGFHRYSVDAKWKVPHFEKMLYDQALLAWIYLESYRATSEPDYRRTALEALDFSLRDLRDPKGAFWSALNAESPGPDGNPAEGAWYLWTLDEVQGALGEKDGPLFCRVYEVTRGGDLDGRNVLHRLEGSVGRWSRELKVAPTALEERLAVCREKLLAARGRRPRPSVDDKVLASWNGLMIRALALAYDVAGEVRYREAAERAASFVLTEMRDSSTGRLRRSYRAGKTQPQAFLDDYAYLAVGLLELYRATGDERWLREAAALCRVMGEDFWDEAAGTFYSTPARHEPLIARPALVEDHAVPSGQSMAALALVRLTRAAPDPALQSRAGRLLNAYATEMRRYPRALSNMLLAADAWFTPADAAPPRIVAADPLQEGDPLLPDGDKAPPVRVSLVGLPRSIRAGQDLAVTVVLDIRKGWHVNSDRPGDEFLIPTRVEALPGPFTLLGVDYPPAKQVRLEFSEKPVSVFEGTVRIRVRLRAGKGAEKPGALRLRTRYQACDDTTCLPPVTVVLPAPPPPTKE